MGGRGSRGGGQGGLKESRGEMGKWNLQGGKWVEGGGGGIGSRKLSSGGKSLPAPMLRFCELGKGGRPAPLLPLLVPPPQALTPDPSINPRP